MLNYRIWNTNSSSIYGSFGVGYSISIKNEYRNSNYRRTNEILGTVFEIPVSQGAYFYDDSRFDNSGFNINTGIKYSYKKVLLNFIYINKRYQFKTIGKAHTFLLNLGYQLN
jgi:hypothetical protein